MQVTYNPNTPALAVINEIKYYMALSALKKMLADGVKPQKITTKPLLLLPKGTGF